MMDRENVCVCFPAQQFLFSDDERSPALRDAHVRYVLLQLSLPAGEGRAFALELVVSDSARRRRRLLLSTAFASGTCTPLHAQIPLGCTLDAFRGGWLEWRLDVHALAERAFGVGVAVSLDGIAVGPACALRAVLTLRDEKATQSRVTSRETSARAFGTRLSFFLFFETVSTCMYLASHPLPNCAGRDADDVGAPSGAARALGLVQPAASN